MKISFNPTPPAPTPEVSLEMITPEVEDTSYKGPENYPIPTSEDHSHLDNLIAVLRRVMRPVQAEIKQEPEKKLTINEWLKNGYK